jgi:hypothetical protein
VRLLAEVLYVYGWYAATVVVAGLVLVLITWAIHSAMRLWRKQ